MYNSILVSCQPNAPVQERTVPGGVENIRSALEWAGVNYDYGACASSCSPSVGLIIVPIGPGAPGPHGSYYQVRVTLVLTLQCSDVCLVRTIGSIPLICAQAPRRRVPTSSQLNEPLIFCLSQGTRTAVSALKTGWLTPARSLLAQALTAHMTRPV